MRDMTSRERVLATLDHMEPDKVPIDIGGVVTTSISRNGHANRRSDDYSSTAYWCQAEPHRPFSILPVEERIRRSNLPEVTPDVDRQMLDLLRTRFSEEEIAHFRTGH